MKDSFEVDGSILAINSGTNVKTEKNVTWSLFLEIDIY